MRILSITGKDLKIFEIFDSNLFRKPKISSNIFKWSDRYGYITGAIILKSTKVFLVILVFDLLKLLLRKFHRLNRG